MNLKTKASKAKSPNKCEHVVATDLVLSKQELIKSEVNHLEAKQKRAMFKSLSGCAEESGGMSIVQSAYQAFPKSFDADQAMQATSELLTAIAPQDSIEGMLGAQIIALNAQGMRYLQRAEHQSPMLCHAESAINMAVKLLRLKNETIEALTRYRRKGEQKVVVQHINVNDAAQAIIGDITPIKGGGGRV